MNSFKDLIIEPWVIVYSISPFFNGTHIIKAKCDFIEQIFPTIILVSEGPECAPICGI